MDEGIEGGIEQVEGEKKTRMEWMVGYSGWMSGMEREMGQKDGEIEQKEEFD